VRAVFRDDGGSPRTDLEEPLMDLETWLYIFSVFTALVLFERVLASKSDTDSEKLVVAGVALLLAIVWPFIVLALAWRAFADWRSADDD